MSGGKTPHQGKGEKADSEPFDVTRFDVTVPTLPKRITEGALRSGGYPYSERMKRRTYEKQVRLLHARQHDPLKRWKLTRMDLAAIGKWDE